MSSPLYIVDTSCLTQAARQYYPFDLAPSFWNFMKAEFNNGSLILINKVKQEIDWGKDALTNWLNTEIPGGLHLDCHADANIMANYGNIMIWGNSNPQYTVLAKAEFSDFDNADPFVVAAAIEKSAFVISQEISAPNSKKNIKLPDTCIRFSIPHMDTFSYLRSRGFSM